MCIMSLLCTNIHHPVMPTMTRNHLDPWQRKLTTMMPDRCFITPGRRFSRKTPQSPLSAYYRELRIPVEWASRRCSPPSLINLRAFAIGSIYRLPALIPEQIGLNVTTTYCFPQECWYARWGISSNYSARRALTVMNLFNLGVRVVPCLERIIRHV